MSAVSSGGEHLLGLLRPFAQPLQPLPALSGPGSFQVVVGQGMIRVPGKLPANPVDATRHALDAAVKNGMLPGSHLTLLAPQDTFRPSRLFTHEYTAPTGLKDVPSGLPCVARIRDDGAVSHVTVGANLDAQGNPFLINLGEYPDQYGLQIGDPSEGTLLHMFPNEQGVLLARGPKENPFLLPDGPQEGAIGGIITPEQISQLPKGDYGVTKSAPV